MNKTLLQVGVPTSTGIISKKSQLNMVVVFDSPIKFPGKKLLPGGRVLVGQQSFLETVIAEAGQEVKITDLTNIRLFTLSSKPTRDVRIVTLEDFLDGKPIPEGLDNNSFMIQAYHGFDAVYMAETEMEPTPDNQETKNAYFIDVFNFDPNEFALDHGKLLSAYARFLRTGELPAVDEF
jgi:ADP-ribose pyrophosphatase YjhB (NUDIX family)